MSAVITRREDGYTEIKFTYRREVVEALKLTIPSAYRSYDPDWRIWTVAPGWFRRATQLLEEAFGVDSVTIVDERPFTQRASAATPPANYDPDFADLHLLPTMPPEIVVICYRELSKRHHPDRGGDVAIMQKINAAFDNLKARGVLTGGGR